MAIVPSKLPAEISGRDLGRLLALSVSRVGQLASEGVIPRMASGLYDPCIAVPAYIAYKAAANVPAGFSAARTKLMEERARLTQLERLERERELIPAAQLESGWISAFMAVRDRLLAAPNRIAARWGLVRSTAEAAVMAREIITEILQDIAKMPVVVSGVTPAETQAAEEAAGGQ